MLVTLRHRRSYLHVNGGGIGPRNRREGNLSSYGRHVGNIIANREKQGPSKLSVQSYRHSPFPSSLNSRRDPTLPKTFWQLRASRRYQRIFFTTSCMSCIRRVHHFLHVRVVWCLIVSKSREMNSSLCEAEVFVVRHRAPELVPYSSWLRKTVHFDLAATTDV